MSPARVDESASRRAVLLGALAVAPLAGCDAVSDGAGSRGPDTPTRDADRALVDDAVEIESELVALVTPLTRTGPERQRRRARATLRVHQQHLALLEGGSAREDGSAPRRRATKGVDAVATAEDRAARRHRDAAGRAASGPFARVLAAMAAASAQQAQVWRS